MSVRDQIQSTGLSILDAVDGLTDWRTLLLALGGLLTVALFGGISAYVATKSMAFGGLLMFITVIWSLVVFNSVGLQVMVLLKSGERLTVGEAAIGGLGALPRVIGLALILGVGYLVLMLAALLLFLVCKIPGVGPFLYTFVFPLSVLCLGFATFSLIYVAFPLACPAIWEGKGVMEALGMLWGIARGRAVQVIVMFILLGLLTGILAGLIGFVLMSGMFASSAMSAIVISDLGGGGFGMGVGLANAMSRFGGGGDYVVAAGVGSVILFATIGGTVALVFLRGICTIYIQAASGLDTGAEAARLRAVMEKTKGQMEETRLRMKEKMERPAAAPVPTVTAALCPACHAPVGIDDRFCESCGHKLQ